ncbi:MAG: hypothetical protein M9952_06960 [Microthrixaceae bacterium]|nr:hypothetical protein [Microthrixaceae bacterium]
MTDLTRSARAMTVLTVVSRVSGFARMVVFAAVFGGTVLDNVYNSSNTIPNILFELFAAGALQAVLVPTMVRLMPHTDTTEEAEDLAGTLVGVLGVVLAALGLLAALTGPHLMGWMLRDIDPAVRDRSVEVGALFLWFFAPQLVFYGVNVVATAVLNAKNHFALPVFAPTLNNLVVIVAYLMYALVHDGEPSLTMTAAEVWLVAGGTTAAVIAFCILPAWAVRRSGFSLRPRFNLSNPALFRLVREGAWAGVFLGFTQVILVVVIVVANRVTGGTTAYNLAFVLFTLPHALFAVPVMTTRFPEMSRAADSGDWAGYVESLSTAVRSIGFLTLLSSAAVVALAYPGARIVAFGQGASLAGRIGEATLAFAPGLIGWSLLLLFTRACYARGDARTPALVNGGVAALCVTVMLGVVPRLGDEHLITGLTGTYAAGNLVGAAVLGMVLARRAHGDGVALVQVGSSLALNAVASVVAGGIGVGVTATLGSQTRTEALIASAVGAPVVLGVFLGVRRLLGGSGPRTALSSLGAQ